MIKIKYEYYINDYTRSYHDQSFTNMNEFKEWMFGLMHRPYVENGRKNMWFPSEIKTYNGKDELSRINIEPEWGGASYWIYFVSDSDRVVFSTGKYTNGKCYISEGMRSFMKGCQDRRDGKVEAFEFGELDGFLTSQSEDLHRKALDMIKNDPLLAKEIYTLISREREIKRDDAILKPRLDDEISAARTVFEQAHSDKHSFAEKSHEPEWKIVMVSEGGTKRDYLGGFKTEQDAISAAHESDWRFVDENEFEWRLEVEEDVSNHHNRPPKDNIREPFL